VYKKLFVVCNGFCTEHDDAREAALAAWLAKSCGVDVHVRHVAKQRGKNWFHLDTTDEEQYRKIRKARFELQFAGVAAYVKEMRPLTEHNRPREAKALTPIQ
jgi:hypothetical protein